MSRFCISICVISVALIVGFLSSLPPHTHWIPANSLPPKYVWTAGFALLSTVDSVLRALTPPNLYMFKELMGYLHTVEIYSAAELRVADAIASYTEIYFPRGGSSHSAGVPIRALGLAIAPGCESAPPNSPGDCMAVSRRLSRLLRALSAYGVFRELPAGSDSWVNTPSSTFLLEAHPYSLRPAALNFGRTQYTMMERLPESIVTGDAAFKQVHGGEFWGWYKEHPVEHAIFDGTMNALGKLGAADLAIARDFLWGQEADTVVDVGGGTGEMAAEVLRSCPVPPKRAIIFDMPDVIKRSQEVWSGNESRAGSAHLQNLLKEHPNLSFRVSHAPGDMFSHTTIPIPSTASTRYAYMLRDILHDWADEECVKILRSLRTAIKGSPQSSVAVVARMIVPGAGFIKSLGSTDADIVMMGAFGTTAGERTKEQYEELFKEAGLALHSVTPTRSQYFILLAKVANQ